MGGKHPRWQTESECFCCLCSLLANVSICRLLHRINQAPARAISLPSGPISSLLSLPLSFFFFFFVEALTNTQQEQESSTAAP